MWNVGFAANFQGYEFNDISVRCPTAGKKAPQVTRVEVVRILSNGGGIENFDYGQTRSYQEHNDDEFKIVTLVCGYGGGSRDFATYGGAPSKILATREIDTNRDGIVDGFLTLWDVGGKITGTQFFYQSPSVDGSGSKNVTIFIP